MLLGRTINRWQPPSEQPIRAQTVKRREDKSRQRCSSVTSWTNCSIHDRLAATSCSCQGPTLPLPFPPQKTKSAGTSNWKKKKLQSKQREATKSPLLGGGGGGGSSSASTSSVLIANQSVDRSGESPLTRTRRAVRNSFQLKRPIKAQFYQKSAHQKRPIKRGINMNIMSAAALSLNCTECCMLSALH